MNREEYLQTAKDRFGDNPNEFVLECPMCHYQQSRNKIMKLAEEGKFKSMRYGKLTPKQLREKQPSIEQECLSKDCNYVSYGLIQLGIEIKGKYYFPLAETQKNPSVVQKN